MIDPTFFQEVKHAAMYFATCHYQRAHPAASADAAYQHAHRSWRCHVPMALDFIALRRADDAARAAAANN